MRPVLFLCLGLTLAACGTPQEQCIRRSTTDLRVVDRLIATSEENLRRGYALENVTISRDVWRQCIDRSVAEDGSPVVTSRPCLQERSQTVTRPRAITLNEEAATLASLKTRRTGLVREANAAVAQCRVQFPEA